MSSTPTTPTTTVAATTTAATLRPSAEALEAQEVILETPVMEW